MGTRQSTLEKCKAILNKDFEKCPCNLRKKLFLELEAWAIRELVGNNRKTFLKALYEAEITQTIQMEIALDKALSRLGLGEAKHKGEK